MELEVGLKITKNVDETCTDFRLAKDRGGIVFVSTETDTMFILTAHLRGYKWESIKIDINDDAILTISGEKQVQEMLMGGLTIHKKEIEIKRFTKVFQIPNGVILDRVKANFNEIDSILTIYMSKLKKGIVGGNIQEIKEEIIKGSQDKQGSNNSNEIKDETQKCDRIEEIHEEKEESSQSNRHEDGEDNREREAENETNEEDRTRSDDQNVMEKNKKKCSLFFSPCFFAGGAFIVSLVVLVCSFVKLKR
ncbi:uncharacterized protein LOC141658818 [Silene latifolia]|uniref:uncharacterized protein LOC141658818 n=1 Tax=Silene latifolia TaxID=37657 RepID=UPI003D77465F